MPLMNFQKVKSSEYDSNFLVHPVLKINRNIHLIGRRGPVQSAFTTKELRELINLDNVCPQIYDKILLTNESDEIELKARAKKRMFDLLRKILLNKPSGQEKQLFFHFLKSPVEFIPDPDNPNRVGEIKLESNYLKGEPDNQKAYGTGHYSNIKTSLIFKSIGYKTRPIEGLPFDKSRSIISNINGRVTDNPGVYVCGWAKRGPSGIIGTNKWDAEEVISAIYDDYINKRFDIQDKQNVKEKVNEILKERNVKYIDFEDWSIINDLEINRGKEKGKVRDKFTTKEEIFEALKSKDSQ